MPRAELARLVVLALAAAAICLVVFDVTRTLTFHLDDWAFLVNRRDWSIDTFLKPHNQHASIVPVAIFKLLIETQGATGYGPYAAVLLGSHVVVAFLVYVAVRRVAPGWWALGSALLILGLMFADEILFWAFELSWTLSVAGGLAAWILWTRPGRWPWDVAAGVALAVSVFSSSVGLIWLGAVTGVMVLAHRTPSRLAVVGTVIGLFGLWFLTHGWSGPSESSGPNLLLLPEFVARGLGQLASAVLALDWRMELLGALIVFTAFGAAIAWARPAGPRFTVALLALVGFYAAIGIARLEAFGPEGAMAPRYVYPGATFLVLAVAEVARSGLPRLSAAPLRWKVMLGAAMAAWICLFIVGNAAKFERSEAIWTDRAIDTRVQLAVVGALRDHLPDDDIVIDPRLTAGLTPGQFVDVVDTLGSPVPFAPAWLMSRSDEERLLADVTFFRMLRSELSIEASEGPDGQEASGTWLVVDAEQTGRPDGCLAVRPTGKIPRASVAVEQDHEIHARFRGDRAAVVHLAVVADDFQAPTSLQIFPERDRWYVISLPELPDPYRWRVRVDPPGGQHSMDLCLVPAASMAENR